MSRGPWRTTDDGLRTLASNLRARGISDERVLAAMAVVPRARFVTPGDEHRADEDVALPIEAGQAISQPSMVARMTELLATTPGDRVLEVGTGSGYQAAILAELGCHVTTIERHASLAAAARARLADLGYGDRIDVRVGDGSLGAADGSPWDGIIVTAAAPAIPAALRDQLADGARLMIPVGRRTSQVLMVVTRDGDAWTEAYDVGCVFVPLVGAGGFDETRSP